MHVGRDCAYCVLVKHNVEIHGCDLLVAGTDCRWFSSCNNMQPEFCEHFAAAGYFHFGSSGVHIAGLLSYVQRRRPGAVLMENVVCILNKTKFGRLIDTLMDFELLGYAFGYRVANTKDYHIPQNRQPVYMWARMHFVLAAFAIVPVVLPHFKRNCIFDIGMLMRDGPCSLQCCRRRCTLSGKWLTRHEAYKRTRAIGDTSRDDRALPSHLVGRIGDSIAIEYVELRRRSVDLGNGWVFISVSQNVGRIAVGIREVLCITFGLQLWDTRRSRCLGGGDFFAAQRVVDLDEVFPHWRGFPGSLLAPCRQRPWLACFGHY